MTDIDSRMERYIGGDMDRAERGAFEREILSNPSAGDRLYADVNLETTLQRAAQARRERAWRAAPGRPWWRWHGMRWVLPAAAVTAAIAFLIAREPDVREPAPVFRSDADAPTAIAPRDEVAVRPSTFVWRRSESAEFYRFELFDASASVPLFTTITADTTVTPESSEIPDAGYWVVTPLNDLRTRAGDAVLTRYRVRQER